MGESGLNGMAEKAGSMNRDSAGTGAAQGRFGQVLASADRSVLRLALITVLVFIAMSALDPKHFLTLANFGSMSVQFPQLGLLSLAMTVTMLTGGIDLSVVGIANLSGILAALALTRGLAASPDGAGSVWYSLLGVGISLSTGVLCGLFNGFLISRAGIAPILATLGTMQLYTGIGIYLTKGSAVFGLPRLITYLGNGVIGPFPVPLLIFALLTVVVAVLLNRFPFGLKVRLLGTNSVASKYAGIDNASVLLRTYALSGLLASVAGVLIMAQTNSAKADYGASYTLQAILVSVLGGVNPNGGFGSVLGVLLAILILQFLSSGFNMLQLSNFFTQFMWGAMLLFAMVINFLASRRQEIRSQIEVPSRKTQDQAR